MVRFPFLFWFYLFNLSGWLIVWPIFLLSTGCFIEYQGENKMLTILLEYACSCFFLLAIKLKGCVSYWNLGLIRFIVADKLFYFMYFFYCLKTFSCVCKVSKQKTSVCSVQKTILLVKEMGCCFSLNELRLKIIDLTALCENYSYLRPKGTITFTVDRKYVKNMLKKCYPCWYSTWWLVREYFSPLAYGNWTKRIFCSINKNAKKL